MVDGRDEAPPGAVVVVGASAGGVEALSRLVADLGEDLGAAVLVVLHVPIGESMLPQILDRAGALPAGHATDGEALEPNRIYVAPPDRHLVIADGHVCLVRGPQENGHRPAIDPLFRSAAVSYGPRAVAVVLSGSLDDGAAGCAAVARHGGTVVVQDPEDADHPSMPLHAIAADHPDYVVELAKMGAAITEGVERARALPPEEPEAESLLHAQSETIDDALWMAFRALQERAELAGRLEKRMGQRGLGGQATRYERRREEAERAASTIRELLLGRDAETA